MNSKKIGSFCVLCLISILLCWHYLLHGEKNTDQMAGGQDSLCVVGADKKGTAHRLLGGHGGQAGPVETGHSNRVSKIGQEQLLEEVDGQTLTYFRRLQGIFRKYKTVDEHLQAVKDYLWSKFSPEKARFLFAVYQRYLRCEIDLAEQLRYLDTPRGIDQALERLEWIRQFREEELGAELADRLFKQDYAVRKYHFQQASILQDNTLTAQEKEEQLSRLKEELSAQGIALPPLSAYQEYQLKLMLYKHDLEQMSAEERQAKIREIREKCFTPQEIARMEAADRQRSRDMAKMSTYQEQKKAILADQDLNATEKLARIKTLQDDLFGDRADGLRRREKMQQVLEELQKRHNS